MSLPLNKVVLGDCIEVMAGWPENSVDLIVTDPPYGLNFMGLDFDKALPPKEAFEQMIRVLKPGALAFVMSSPRQDVLWRMLSMLEGVGFQLKTSAIFWIYRTGFPKSYDVSKGIDKKFGRLNQSVVEIKKKLREIYEKSGKPLSQINRECRFNATGYLALFDPEKRPNPWTHVLPSYEKWLKIKQVTGYSNKDLDEIFKEAEREVIGKRGLHFYSEKDHPTSQVPHENFEEANQLTAPASDLAKQWEGWKSQTGLKPAAEVVLMVNKPRSEPTIVDNVLRWGTGAINVDACRIPFRTEDDVEKAKVGFQSEEILNPNTGWNPNSMERLDYDPPSKGRFPANLLISDGALDTGKTTRSGKFESHHKIAKDENGHSVKNVYGKYRHLPADQQVFYGDEGSPFRFFDLDAWAEHHGFLDVAKPSKAERDFGLNTQPLQVPKSKFNLNDGSKDMRFDGVIPTPRRNVHPTCKPVKLMAYLIELGCPPKGIVVDPFVGSGTTCIAAKRLRRRWIGIEINPEYAEIARARIDIKGPLDQYMEAEK